VNKNTEHALKAICDDSISAEQH